MRIARLFSMLLALAVAGLCGLVAAPAAGAEPPLRVPDYVTDNAGVLSPSQRAQVESAIDQLYNDNRTRLWVVYVERFGQDPVSWAQSTMDLSGFGAQDALLAVAIGERSYAFLVPPEIMSSSDAAAVQRNDIEPALREGDWAGAAVAAADGLAADRSSGSGISWPAMLVALAVLAVLVLILVLWSRRRRTKRRAAEFEAAKRVDPTDPNALASVPIDALDDLSRYIVVDVDNAVRTSEGELALAIGEFGTDKTEPFSRALTGAKTALAQAFNVRQILDDAIPESPLQRRELLTRVVVSAAKADRELETQTEAFEKLRDVVINAPSRLDTLTQQMVDITARMDPAEQTLDALHKQFNAAALSSVADNIDSARERVAFADRNITEARALTARPAGDQTGLIDAIHAAESALGQARTMLEAVNSASSDINRAMSGLPAAVADIRQGIAQATTLLDKPDTPQADALRAARDAATEAADDAEKNGNADPLGTFTRLTTADADLDQLLASVHEQREAAERLARALDQAMFSAQSRIKAVSDFIDTRRGSIGPEARTRLAEASRQYNAAEAKRQNNPSEAIAHANGAAMLAAQAQSLANDDVRAVHSHYGGGGGSDMGAMIGGIIIGNVLRGGFSGGFGGGYGGGFGGGRGIGRSSSYGGSSRSSGRSYSGGGGRF